MGGTTTMLSVDQFLRLISVPAVIVAFLIASQVSGGVSYRPAQLQVASEEPIWLKIVGRDLHKSPATPPFAGRGRPSAGVASSLLGHLTDGGLRRSAELAALFSRPKLPRLGLGTKKARRLYLREVGGRSCLLPSQTCRSG